MAAGQITSKRRILDDRLCGSFGLLNPEGTSRSQRSGEQDTLSSRQDLRPSMGEQTFWIVGRIRNGLGFSTSVGSPRQPSNDSECGDDGAVFVPRSATTLFSVSDRLRCAAFDR